MRAPYFPSPTSHPQGSPTKIQRQTITCRRAPLILATIGSPSARWLSVWGSLLVMKPAFPKCAQMRQLGINMARGAAVSDGEAPTKYRARDTTNLNVMLLTACELAGFHSSVVPSLPCLVASPCAIQFPNQ